MNNSKKLGTVAYPDVLVEYHGVDRTQDTLARLKTKNFDTNQSQVREHNRAKRFGREQRQAQIDD